MTKEEFTRMLKEAAKEAISEGTDGIEQATKMCVARDTEIMRNLLNLYRDAKEDGDDRWTSFIKREVGPVVREMDQEINGEETLETMEDMALRLVAMGELANLILDKGKKFGKAECETILNAAREITKGEGR